MGPIVKEFGIFVVTDDGGPNKLHGVWREDATLTSAKNDGQTWYNLVGSGMQKDTAKTVAEALYKCKAGQRGSILTESF